MVHLAIAHAVVDSDEYLLRAPVEKLAAKALCSVRTVHEAQTTLATGGYLEIINDWPTPRRPKEYRFVMPPWATFDRDPEQDPQFEMNAGTVRLTLQSLEYLVNNMRRAQESMSLGDMEAVNRELIVTRHIIDVAQLTTVDSITKREPSPDMTSEFISVVEDLRKLLAPKY